ncbi:hypothetical protein K439DRAFT_561450 [Ramaria rubella]|nr:hypothetical protein K439DRAFT_561450 [Ramaria rubella]
MIDNSGPPIGWNIAGVEGGGPWWTRMYQRPARRRGDMACAYRLQFLRPWRTIDRHFQSITTPQLVVLWPTGRSAAINRGQRKVLICIPIGGINMRSGWFQHAHHSIYDRLNSFCIYWICDHEVMQSNFGITHHFQQSTGDAIPGIHLTASSKALFYTRQKVFQHINTIYYLGSHITHNIRSVLLYLYSPPQLSISHLSLAGTGISQVTGTTTGTVGQRTGPQKRVDCN